VIRGVDASFTRLTPVHTERLKADGFSVWWQCLWTGTRKPANAIDNLRVADQAGLWLMGYTSVTGGASGRWHADQGRAGVPDEIWDKLLLAVVDVELAGIPNTTVRAAVERTYELGKRRAIYTNYNSWVNMQGNPHDFIDCLLINAAWVYGGGMPDKLLPLQYGGWQPEQVAGRQYDHDRTLYAEGDDPGIVVDFDVFEEGLIMDGYTKAEVDAKVGALLGQLGKIGADQRALTIDVQNVFRYAYEHALNADLHNPGAVDSNEGEMLAAWHEIQKRLDAGAEELRQAVASDHS